MKLLLSVALALITFSSKAQNWAPINVTEQYNYKLGGSELISHAIKVDSSNFQADSVLYLNRIVKPCDTCWIEEIEDSEFEYMNGNYWLKNQPQFLMGEVEISDENEWFFGGEDGFIINPDAELAEQWQFSPSLGLYAAVSFQTTTDVLGVQDSVKTILLGNGRIIIISKNHGITKFPDFSSDEDYILVGKEGTDEGELLPRFEDIYDFSVGDVIQYRKRAISSSESTGNQVYTDIITNKKKTITDLTYYTDSIIVTYEILTNDSIFDTNTALHSIIETSVMEETRKYTRGFYDLTSKIPYSETTINDQTRVCTYFLDPTGRIIQSFSGYKFLEYESDHQYFDNINVLSEFGFYSPNYFLAGSGTLFSQNIWGFDIANSAYSPCLGVISSQRQFSGYLPKGPGDWGSNDNYITAFEKANGESEGVLYTDSEILGVESLPENDFQLFVFPNPSNGEFQIRSSSVIQAFTIRDLSGRIIEKKELDVPNLKSSFNLSDSGIYLLKFSFSDGSYQTKKIIVE